MVTKQFLQLSQVSQEGVTVFHPETNADYIVPGATYKVPTAADLKKYDSAASELSTLKENLARELTAHNLLELIKTVDENNSGLNATSLNGATINDLQTNSTSLWTSAKINEELAKVRQSFEVTPSPSRTYYQVGNMVYVTGEEIINIGSNKVTINLPAEIASYQTILSENYVIYGEDEGLHCVKSETESEDYSFVLLLNKTTEDIQAKIKWYITLLV